VITALNAPVRLFRNEIAGPDTNWLVVYLNTDADPSLAPDGIGSRITATMGGVTLYRNMDSRTTWLGQSELLVHFGLGSASVVDQLVVEWANGTTTVMNNVDANQALTLSPSCNIDADCDDGLFCNGNETCSAGICQAGADPCGGQACDESLDACVQCLVDLDCDDGQFCNGAESCIAGACQAGSDPCAGLGCDEVSDVCQCSVDADCDDGLFCNGAEVCNAGACLAGTPPDCDDGVGCTIDSCNETTDSCDNTPDDSICDDGLFCSGVETCDAVADCQAGSDPCAGDTCDDTTDSCGGVVVPRVESGSASVGGAAVTVNLTNSYVNPVVVCTVQYNANTTPVVARVANVTATSFDVWLQNPSNGPVQVDNVNYLVVEEGAWTVNGVNLEARTYASTVTDENDSWSGEFPGMLQTYTTPVVVGQVMSANDPEWSVFWTSGRFRSTSPACCVVRDFRTGKTVNEDPNTTRADETVGFVIFEAGHGSIGGVEFEAAVGAKSVQGATQSAPYLYTFNTAFASAPQVVVATTAGPDNSSGPWAQTHGPTQATSTTLFLSADEDQTADPERNHGAESVSYIVFEAPLVYP